MSDLNSLQVPYEIKFTLAGLPKRTNNNARCHWAVQHREARKWKDLVRLAVGHRRPEKPLTRARLVLTRISSVEPDFDGLVSGFKHVIDGLVEAGVIADDKMSIIGAPEYQWERGRRGDGAIAVHVIARR